MFNERREKYRDFNEIKQFQSLSLESTNILILIKVNTKKCFSTRNNLNILWLDNL